LETTRNGAACVLRARAAPAVVLDIRGADSTGCDGTV
jgi:hypothetical protein